MIKHIITIMALLFLFTGNVNAKTIRLSWTHSGGATEFRAFANTGSGYDYENPVCVSTIMECTFQVPDQQRHGFVVRAYGVDGESNPIESINSNEVFMGYGAIYNGTGSVHIGGGTGSCTIQ